MTCVKIQCNCKSFTGIREGLQRLKEHSTHGSRTTDNTMAATRKINAAGEQKKGPRFTRRTSKSHWARYLSGRWSCVRRARNYHEKSLARGGSSCLLQQWIFPFHANKIITSQMCQVEQHSTKNIALAYMHINPETHTHPQAGIFKNSHRFVSKEIGFPSTLPRSSIPFIRSTHHCLSISSTPTQRSRLWDWKHHSISLVSSIPSKRTKQKKRGRCMGGKLPQMQHLIRQGETIFLLMIKEATEARHLSKWSNVKSAKFPCTVSNVLL